MNGLIRNIILSTVFCLIFISDACCWLINKYDVDISIDAKGDLKITERLTVDFGFENKHGIYRDIPTEFKDPTGKNREIEIKDIFVTDEKINPLQTKISRNGNNLRIRIGDPNKYVSGTQNYVIHYTVKYALYNIGNIDELYWNAIGTGWAVPIKKGITKVYLPFDNPSIQFACYTGAYGSIGKDCKIIKKANEINFILSRELSPHEGMTIAVGWPKGLIKIESGPPWWKNPWIFTIIYIPSLFAFLYWLWWHKGRDIKGRGVIQVQYYPPEDMTPLEAGTLIDEKVDSRDIVAEIIDLARRGYIKIVEIEEEQFLFFKKRDYIFQLIKDYDSDILSKDYDVKILNAIFEGGKKRNLSDLRKKFYRAISDITKSVFFNLTKKGLFIKNPISVRNKYSLLAIIILFVTIFGSIGFHVSLGNAFPIIFSGVVTSISLFIFGYFMPKKTHRGSLIKEYLKGYEEFITRVEKNIIEKLFPPEKIPEVFEITLPYAIAFGEAEKWASAFEGLFTEPPNWYHGRGSFSPTSFAYSINTFATMACDILSSQPRSSGSSGGFSGGGGGGGGGGSW
ncbi:MAG: DUF2207 domain-containing protein [Thermodesulfovibrio sp.]|nr:DUF2207 domain-containing protein [Thermodesulfovibrio sp.]MDW7998111.1 DUF2207 domain-containing protein [Thermodesulfovibrio sp.]